MPCCLRWLVVVATALVLFGCGSRVSPANLGTARTGPSTASDKLAAQRDADKLLGQLVLPAGASRLMSEPRGDGGLLRVPGSKTDAFDIVDRSGLWRVQSSFGSVVALLGRHQPSGSRRIATGSELGPHIPSNKMLIFSFPAISGRIGKRWLIVTVVALPDGSTGVRADAQDAWIVTRSPSEKIPSGVAAINLTSGYPRMRASVSLQVTDQARIRQVVRWIDTAQVDQPAVIACPALAVGPIVTLDFRAANGTLLAQASGLDFDGTSGPCNPIEFRIRGQRQPPLAGGDFFKRLQRLLGVHLNPPARTGFPG